MKSVKTILEDYCCELRVPENKIIKMCPFCFGEATVIKNVCKKIILLDIFYIMIAQPLEV